MSRQKHSILDALGWNGYDLHTVSINMLDRCMAARLPGLDAVLQEHFQPGGRTKDLATGQAAVPMSPAYRKTFLSFVHALVGLVRTHNGSLDLLVRGETVRSPAEMVALMEARSRGDGETT